MFLGDSRSRSGSGSESGSDRSLHLSVVSSYIELQSRRQCQSWTANCLFVLITILLLISNFSVDSNKQNGTLNTSHDDTHHRFHSTNYSDLFELYRDYDPGNKVMNVSGIHNGIVDLQSMKLQTKLQLTSQQAFLDFKPLHFVFGTAKLSQVEKHVASQLSAMPVIGFSFGDRLLLASNRYDSQQLYLKYVPKTAITTITISSHQLISTSDTETEFVLLPGLCSALLTTKNISQLSLEYPETQPIKLLHINSDILPPTYRVLQWQTKTTKAIDHHNQTLGGKLTSCPLLWQFDHVGETTPSQHLSIKEKLFEEVENEKTKEYFQLHPRLIQGVLSSTNSICNISTPSTLANIEMQQQIIEEKAIHYGYLASLVAALEIYLFIMQFRFTIQNVSAIKLSIASIFLQTQLDAIITFLHFLFQDFLIPNNQLSSFSLVSMLHMTLFAVLSSRFLVTILRSQHNNNSLQSVELERMMLQQNIRFTVCFVLLFSMVLQLFAWPVLFVFVLYSFWVPQIVHSAITGTRRGLQTQFVVGLSLLRMVIPIYFLLCPNNFFLLLLADNEIKYASFNNQRGAAAVLLVLWLGCQASVLLLQDKYGSRFFVPGWIIPPPYDYHRKIPTYLLTQESNSNKNDDDIENNHHHHQQQDNDDVNETTPLSGHTRLYSKECAICFADIPNEQQQAYMITPCNHLFHTACLQQWMDIKLECPVCRAALPPTDTP